MPSPTTSSPVTTVSLSNSLNIDALLEPVKWGGGVGTGVVLSYSFPWSAAATAVFAGPAGASYSAANEQLAAYVFGLNATQQAAARAALQSWGDVANISFQEVADTAGSVGDIRFAFSSAVGPQFWGYCYTPDSYWSSAGDIWINALGTGATDPNYSVGSYNYYSLIHEIGHALGLKHPFEGTPLLPVALDTRQNSVMSYTNPANSLFRTITNNANGSISLNYQYVNSETPMVLDIAAIQYLYGANMNFRTGNDVYSFDAATPFFKTIWDAGGNDTISVGNFAENCRIDLTPGSYSSIRIVSAPIPAGFTITGGTQPTYDGTHNLGIAYGAIIENAIGGSGADTLIGNSADNSLDGGAGADTMTGGLGNDIYIVDNAADVTAETSALAVEIDTVQSSVSWTLGANLERLVLTGTTAINGVGNGLGNTLTGNGAANILSGGGGNDILDGGGGADKMNGGVGRDTYIVDNAADLTTEISTLATEIDTVQSSVSRTLGANLENLVLTGTAAINGIGNALNNSITGNAAANTINGGAGNDVLDGGAGIDTMIGSVGNDTYIVDSVADIILETSTLAAEIDTVQSSVTRTLGANQENLTLTGTAAINGTGNTLNNMLTGNSAANTLTGGAGNDTLDGGGGVDRMIGGVGNDLYVVDNAADITAESSTLLTEIDTVQSSVTRMLGANLEILELTGAAAINGTGNALNNTMTGNGAANILNGGLGDDVLDGGGGADTLIGGSGSDILSGGAGDDVYWIDSAGVVAADFAGGDDAAMWFASDGWANGGVFMSSWLASHATASQGMLNLQLDANGLIGGEYATTGVTGYGMYSARLQAASGSGVITSMFTYSGAPHDEIDIEILGKDTTKVQFNYFVNGVGGHEVIIDLGFDAAAGFHEYAFDWQADSIRWYVDGVLKHEVTALNGPLPSAPGKLMANLWAAQGVDAWSGAFVPGTARMASYDWIRYQGDRVVENAGEGVDTVQSAISHSLADNVENLYLTGALSINGVGNALDNFLNGNSASNRLEGGAGNDVLNGGAGVDTMIGGAGNDVYVVNVVGDITIETSALSTEIDTVQSSVGRTLGVNIENLTLTGAAAINGVGNALNNTMTGNGAANILSGAAGNDTLDGGAGNDVLNGGLGNDTYLFGRAGGLDRISDNSGADLLSLAADVSFDQLWFRHVANNLEVGIIGAADKMTVNNWYLGATNQVEQILAGGRTLSNANVETLVQAMAAFAPPAAGQSSLPPAYQTALSTVIAANWV